MYPFADDARISVCRAVMAEMQKKNAFRLNCGSLSWQKKSGFARALDTRQPINADCTAGRVTPELDELLNGEDTG